MHHYDKYLHSRGEHLASVHHGRSIAARLAAAMAEHETATDPQRLSPYVQQVGESDRAYFERRSEEEWAAASIAASAAARDAHHELSARYAQHAASLAARSLLSRPTPSAPVERGGISRTERQDALLDAGLMETFPASDPVSVVLIN